MGITEDKPWSARLANVCRDKIRRLDRHSGRILHVARRGTDHRHSVRQQQLGRGHHGVVGHINQHVEDGHRHHGADDRQRDVSDEHRRGLKVFVKTT